jgi:hypothetical protein
MRDGNEYKILTKHPEGKLGISIDKETYSMVSSYIFLTLKRDEASTLSSLIDRANDYFNSQFHNRTLNSYLFWIKLDLEAKGIIKSVCKKKGSIQSFKLTRKWMNKSPLTLLDRLTGVTA